MGTLGDWLRVAFAGALYGGMMLLFAAHNRKWTNRTPHVFPALIVTWCFGGLAFGIYTQFEFRQLVRWPLNVVALATVVGLLVSALPIRAKLRKVLRPGH